MISTTATLDTILASDYKKVSWLFDVTDKNSNEYHWSTKTYSFGGTDYTFKVTSFNGVTINRLRSELGIISSSDLSFVIDNKDNVITDSDLETGTILLRLVLSDGTNEEVARTWKFRIQSAKDVYQEITLSCEDFIQQYLEDYYPNTSFVSALFPSEKYEDSDLCVPATFGTCYIPLRPVVANSSRYYLLGPSDKTFTISKVRSPREIAGKSEWESGTYSFTQSTLSDNAGGSVWKVFQPIIADSNSDGTPDSCGVWTVQGQYCYDMPTQFSNSETVATKSPSRVIDYVLKDFGIPSSDIDATSFSSTMSTFTSWGIEFAGAFYFKQERTKVLSSLLNQSHSTLYNGEKISLHILSKASQKTITKADVIKAAEVGKGSFTTSNITQEQCDSGYIAFQQAGEAQDEFVKYLVPAKSSTYNISSNILEIPFVQDSEVAQKLGCLYYQRRLLQESNHSFKGKAKLLALQPDDVITINDTDYGGNYDVLIDSMTFNKDASVQFSCIKFKEDLDDWDDLSFSSATIATESETNYWSPVISGPDTIDSSGTKQNALTGRVKIGSDTKYVLIDPDVPAIKVDEAGTDRVILGKIDTDEYGLKIDDASGNEVFRVDSSNSYLQSSNWSTDDGMKIDLDAAKITVRGENALDVEASGGVRVLDAGGIDLVASESKGGSLDFVGTNVGYSLWADDYGQRLSLSTYGLPEDWVGVASFGQSIGAGSLATLSARGGRITSRAYTDFSDEYAEVEIESVGDGRSKHTLTIETGGLEYYITTEVSSTATILEVKPGNDEKVSLGCRLEKYYEVYANTYKASNGIVVGDSGGYFYDQNLISDSSNGSSSTTLYIGNKSITTAFTACHYYQLGDVDLRVGELIRLTNRKIYRTTDPKDPSAIGIFWGITNFKDSFGFEVKSGFAYAVACIGDSYEEHTETPLTGAWVTIKNGKIKAGDYLCSSSKAGYMERQEDDSIHNYTVAKAVEDINKDTKTAYVYLMN